MFFLRYHIELVNYINAKAAMFDDSLIIIYDKNDRTSLGSSLRKADFDLKVYKTDFDSHGKYIVKFIGKIKYRHQNPYRKLSFELKEDVLR